MFRVGYNTNGLVHHRPTDALRLLAELGYEAAAITPDVGALDPLEDPSRQAAELRGLAESLGLTLAVETGARFVLDPRRKHFPTLLEPDAADRARRLDFLTRCVDLAAELGAGVVSIWSGVPPEGERAALWDRLCAGVSALLAHGRERGVRIAFEPEPGMLVARPAEYDALCRRLGGEGDELGLCLDVGHLLCTGDLPVGGIIRRYASRLVQVHLDDVSGGVHEHLMFGQGDLDLAETLEALAEVGYGGIAAVELSRDSHRGVQAAAEALRRIRECLPNPT